MKVVDKDNNTVDVNWLMLRYIDLEREGRKRVKLPPAMEGVDLEEPLPMKRLEIRNRPNINRDAVLAKFDNAQTPEDFEKAMENIDLVISNIAYDENNKYLHILRNPNFLIGLKQRLSSIKELQTSSVKRLNKVIYNIFQTYDNELTEEDIQLFRGILVECNKPQINRLMAISPHNSEVQMTIKDATYLTLSFNSCEENKIDSAIRLNDCMMLLPQAEDKFSVQVIIEIYEALFSSLSTLAFGTIFKADQNTSSFVVEDRQVLAVLLMLDDQGFVLIRNLVRQIIDRWVAYYGADPQQFRGTPNNIFNPVYKNINNVLKELSVI